MAKKNTKQIKSYYQKDNVAEKYDDRRFSSSGGKYINERETLSISSQFSKHLSTDSKVLDLGAGKGRLSKLLKNLGYKVFCLDSSEAMLSFLSKDFPKNQILIQSCFDPIKSRSKFEGITSLRFFDHFKISDQDKILKNSLKKLTKDGIVVYTCLNKNSLESLVSKLFPYGRYNYYYSDQEYRKLFSKNNLEVIDFTSSFFFLRGIFLKTKGDSFVQRALIALDRLFSRLMPKPGAYYVYTLKKAK